MGAVAGTGRLKSKIRDVFIRQLLDLLLTFHVPIYA